MPRLILVLSVLGCGLGCVGWPQLAHKPHLPAAPVPMLASTSQADFPAVADSAQASRAGDPQNSGTPLAAEPATQAPTEGVVLAQANKDQVITASVQEATAMPAFGEAENARPENAILAAEPNAIDLNLPSALAMIGGQHPVVGFARWRVQEAYARLQRAEVLWLPSIQAGFSFRRHDGNYQASSGDIVDANINSFQYGLGTGATGAGTTPNPGLVAQFHLADAIFQPKIAEKNAWASQHNATVVLNERLFQAASAYITLLDAHQDAKILEDSRQLTSDLAKLTGDFARAGEGLQADADRLHTELMLVDNRWIGAQERTAVASARLAQALSIDGRCVIQPLDVTVVPLELVSLETDKSSLIATGLSMRPELKQSQALVAAACEAYRREKYAPFVPSVLLGFSTGGFGGGRGNELDDVEDRYDLDALMTWQVRNFGFGENAARRESAARIQQAKFDKLRVLDQVALEISEAYSQVQFRRQQIAITEKAIQSAQDSYQRNLARIRDGQGLPLEVLQSLQALETARRAYLRAVIDHNQAQFQLQWALGWPVSAPSAT